MQRRFLRCVFTHRFYHSNPVIVYIFAKCWSFCIQRIDAQRAAWVRWSISAYSHLKLLSRHLQPGDRINEINFCALSSTDDVQRCLNVEEFGFCLGENEIRNLRVKLLKQDAEIGGGEGGGENCCGHSPSGLCFTRAENFNSSLGENTRANSHCLNMRRISQQEDRHLCYKRSSECAHQLSCFLPRLAAHERVFIINKTRSGADKPNKEPIVMIGDARDILLAKLTNQQAHFPSYIPLGLDETIQWFFYTCAGISMALALINIVPCVYLDGEKILRILCARQSWNYITKFILYASTTLVFGNLSASLLNAVL